MNYLCLSFQDERQANEPSSRDGGSIQNDLGTQIAELKHSGNLVAATRSIPPATATTVRVRNGRMVLTDGPISAGREHLVGFTIVNARDLNEALRLAARNPLARTGGIEVHPLPDLAIDAHTASS